MKTTWLPAAVAIAAALVSLSMLYPIRKQTKETAQWSGYRRLYDEVSIERDNLHNFIERDYDARAAFLDGLSGQNAVARATVDAGTLGAGPADGYSDRGVPVIITMTNDDDHTKTTYYLNPNGEPFLVVRARPVMGVAEPYVDRWYFVNGEFVTWRNSDPTNRQGFFYTPTGEAEIQRLKDLLAATRDALKHPRNG